MEHQYIKPHVAHTIRAIREYNIMYFEIQKH